MSLMKFFQIIDNSFIGSFIDKRLEVISATDPERIYVENIRSFYNIPTSVAKLFCEMATRENLFKKSYAIECPNDSCQRVISTVDLKSKVPNRIVCDNCLLLEKDKYEFEKKDFKVIEFYKLNT